MSTSSSTLLDADAVVAVPDASASVAVPPAAAAPQPAERPRNPSDLHLRRPSALRRHALRSLSRGTVLATVDAGVLAALVVVLAIVARLAAPAPVAAAFVDALTALGPVLAVLLGALLVAGAYRRRGARRTLGAVLRGAALGVALLSATRWGVVPGVDLAIAAALSLVAAVALLEAGRSASALFLRHVWPGRRGAAPALFVGSRAEFRGVQRSALAARGDYRLVGWVSPGTRRPPDALGSLRSLPTLIHDEEVETVVVGGFLRDERLRHVREMCLAAGCELLYPMRAVRLAGARPRLVWLHDQPYFELGAPVLRARALLVKRVVDVILAAAALTLLAPLMLVLALAVKLDSHGPVLFFQNRAGMGGRRFRMLKFRTMRCGADDEKEQLAHLNPTGDPRLFKIPDDPRVTRFGRFLRRWSLDELPQLLNVLAGEMSLVGPRPFFERDLLTYEDHHFHRLGAQPGITGLWQVSGRSEIVDFEEVVRLDREYIETWSLGLDLWIMLRTVPAVLSRTGAY